VKTRYPVFLGFWFFSVIAAFVAGLDHGLPSATKPTTKVTAPSMFGSPRTAARTLQTLVDRDPKPEAGVTVIRVKGRFAALAAAATKLREEMSEEEFRALLSDVPPLDRPQLLRAWAEISDNALVFSLTEAGGDAYSEVVSDTVVAVARARPAELVDSFAAHPEIAVAQRKRVVEMLVGIGQFSTAEQLAASDPDAAAGFVAARLRADPAISPLALVWRFQSDQVVRDASVDAIAGALQESPEQVRTFVAQALESGVATPASLARAALTMKPLEALNWLCALPVTSSLKGRSLLEAFQAFIADGPEAGAEWLLKQPASEDRDQMVLALCNRLGPDRAAAGRAWADTITTPDLREAARLLFVQ